MYKVAYYPVLAATMYSYDVHVLGCCPLLPSTLYDVRCTMYDVHSTRYIVHSTMHYAVRCTSYTCTLSYKVRCTKDKRYYRYVQGASTMYIVLCTRMYYSYVSQYKVVLPYSTLYIVHRYKVHSRARTMYIT